jgi:hypothetical protein
VRRLLRPELPLQLSSPVSRVSALAHKLVAALAPSATTDGEHRVLRVLADHVNGKTGLCWPSIHRLRQRTGFTARTIERALEKFQQQRVIVEVHRRPNGDRVFGFVALLKNPWKSCGKPVDGPSQRSLNWDPTIANSDPVRHETGPNPEALNEFQPRSGSDQVLDQETREEGADAPVPNVHFESADSPPPTPNYLDKLRQLKAHLDATPRPARRRRFRA